MLLISMPVKLYDVKLLSSYMTGHRHVCDSSGTLLLWKSDIAYVDEPVNISKS